MSHLISIEYQPYVALKDITIQIDLHHEDEAIASSIHMKYAS